VPRHMSVPAKASKRQKDAFNTALRFICFRIYFLIILTYILISVFDDYC